MAEVIYHSLVATPFQSFCSLISDKSGFTIDVVRYLVLWSVSIPLAFLMRYVLRPRDVGTTVRHLYCLGLGLLFGCLCFGWFVLFHVATVAISYVFLLFLSPRVVPYYMLVYITVIVAVTHIYRMVDDYGVYKLDFSGPLMILVQKWSTSAYELHDGLARKEEELNEDQRKNKLKPFCTLKEYTNFIDGSNFFVDNPNKFAMGKVHSKDPSTVLGFLKPFLQSLFFVSLYATLVSTYTAEKVIDPTHSLLQHACYVYVFGQLSCFKYFFVWKLEESINNAAGLGFNGYDSKGYPLWNLVEGCDPLAFETSTSPKMMLGAWNITSALWLRRVVYERVSWQPTLLTFAASAFWHGFYPGYYLCFIPLGFLIEASRKGRRLFRPYFIDKGATVKLFYDVLTWALNILLAHPMAVSILLPHFWDSLAVYKGFYYYPLIIPALIFFLPLKPRKKKTKDVTLKEEKID